VPTAALLLTAALATLCCVALAHARRWRVGAGFDASWRGVFDVPRRYFVHVHEAVGRRRLSAPMHVLVAGGSIAAVLALALGLVAPAIACLVAGLAAVAVASGALLNARRRGAPLARHASGGPWARLAMLCAIAAAALAAPLAVPLATALLPAWVPAWGAILPGLAAIGLLGALGLRGPLRHALAGLVSLAAHPRPGRFEGSGDDVALVPVDIVAGPLGRSGRAEFRWIDLAQFDACVQCGRCEAACPAFAAGQPLNPKRLIHDLARGGVNPPAYHGAGHPGLAPDATTDGAIAAETLWACTTCRACVDACPMFIEHLDAIIDLRRASVLRDGALPAASAAALVNLAATGNRFGAAPAARVAWAYGLGIRELAQGEGAAILLWTGDAAFEPRGQQTLRALATILRRAGIDFAILGEDEPDSGDLARRIGDDVLAQRQATDVVAALACRRIGTILTIDPHVANAFINDMPEIAASWTVLHHAAFLAGLIASGQLRVAPLTEAVTLHDPCYLSRYLGETQAPRALLGALGMRLVEPPRSGRESRCCGWGGGAALADVPGRVRPSDIRSAELTSSGAVRVAVACPNCAVMLAGATRTALPMADLADLVLEAADMAAAA
jgi:Fe-S oxidoreductase